MLRNLIVLVVVLIGVWLVVREVRRHQASRQAGTSKPKRITPMQPCAYCGTHVPADQAVGAGAKRYCSEEHRRLGETG
jgi:uncharacterized protein